MILTSFTFLKECIKRTFLRPHTRYWFEIGLKFHVLPLIFPLLPFLSYFPFLIPLPKPSVLPFWRQNNNIQPCGRHKAASLFIRPCTSLEVVLRSATKRIRDGTMGSKSFKPRTMKSYENNKTGALQKLKTNKKENALDIISKSVFNALTDRASLHSNL